MKITPELLERYHIGKCTDIERKMVARWLDATDDEDAELHEDALKQMEADIWSRLPLNGEEKTTKPAPLYKKIGHYVAAACLLLVAGHALFMQSSALFFSPELTYDNSHASASRQIQTEKIDADLLPGSKLEVAASLNGSIREVNFSGYVKIVSKTEDNTTFNFQTANSKRKVKLKKGETYYVFTQKDQNGNEKIYILDRSNLMLFSVPHVVESFILS